MNRLANSLKAEFVKLKGSSIIHLAYIIPLISSGLLYLIFGTLVFDVAGEAFNDYVQIKSLRVNLFLHFGYFVMLTLPVILSIIPSLVSNLEFKNETNKLLNTLPVPKSFIFLSKIVSTFFVLTIAFMVKCTIIGFAIYLLDQTSIISIEFTISDIISFLLLAFCILFSSIPIIIIHVFLGMKLNLKLLNIFTSLGLFFVSNYLYISRNIDLYYIPHAWSFQIFTRYYKEVDPNLFNVSELFIIISIVTAVLGLLGYFYFKKRELL